MSQSGVSRGVLILLMTLVWTFSWGLSWAVGWFVVNQVGYGYSFTAGGVYGGIFGGVTAGLIGGLGTVVVLKLANPVVNLRWYQGILLVAGWMVIIFYDWLDGFIVAAPGGYPIDLGSGGPLSGMLGGVLMALILGWANRPLRWKQPLIIIAGWTAGFAIGGFIAWEIGFEFAVDYVYGRLYGHDPGFLGFMALVIISSQAGAVAGFFGRGRTYADRDLTWALSRLLWRAALFLWMIPLSAMRSMTGTASVKAARACSASPLLMAAMTFLMLVRTRERRLAL